MQLITCLVPFAFLALIEAALAENANVYNVTLIMSDGSNIEPHLGKLVMQLKSDTFKYDVALSAMSETFKKGEEHTYLIAAPYTIKQIDRVVLNWSPKKKFSDPSSWFNAKIYVKKVILDPSYMGNDRWRDLLVRNYCAPKGYEGIKPKEDTVFRLCSLQYA